VQRYRNSIMKKLTTLITKAIEMTKPYDVPADHAWSRQSVYSRQDMQHLTTVPNAQAVMAWHTGLDIQAVRKADGVEALFLAGKEIPSRAPEQVVFSLASQDEQSCRNQVSYLFGVKL